MTWPEGIWPGQETQAHARTPPSKSVTLPAQRSIGRWGLGPRPAIVAGEDNDRVIVNATVFERLHDLSHSFVHRGDHAGISTAGTFDIGKSIRVTRRYLMRRMHCVERDIKEQRFVRRFFLNSPACFLSDQSCRVAFFGYRFVVAMPVVFISASVSVVVDRTEPMSVLMIEASMGR